MVNIEERIVCSAIWYKDVEMPHPVRNPININRGIVVLGHRHGDIIKNVHNLLYIRTVEYGERSCGEHEQGFLTNQDRFVGREEAARIAVKANQIKNREELNSAYLFSEDLY
jgi:hypothetical protein